MPKEAFDTVDLDEPYYQRPDAFTTLLWVPDDTYDQGEPTTTADFYLELFRVKGLKVGKRFEPSTTNLSLHSSCVRYPKGVHRVVVDLVGKWDESDWCQIPEILAASSEALTGVEALAACALNPPELVMMLERLFFNTGMMLNSENYVCFAALIDDWLISLSLSDRNPWGLAVGELETTPTVLFE